jgi:hypothetical protein
MQKCSAISDRVARARQLIAQGRVKRCGDLHIVNGKGGNYTINLAAETCTCKAGRRGIACYHIQACEIFESRSRIARQKTEEMPKNSLQGIRVSRVNLARMADKLGV